MATHLRVRNNRTVKLILFLLQKKDNMKIPIIDLTGLGASGSIKSVAF